MRASTKSPSLIRRDLSRTDVHNLSALLSVGEDESPDWFERDFADMLDHQMRRTLRSAFEDAGPLWSGALERFLPSRPSLTFREALTSPETPIEVLDLLKRYGKLLWRDKAAEIPREVARILYLSAIAGALVHHGKLISSLNKADLRYHLQTQSEAAWVFEPIKSLLARALVMVPGEPSEVSIGDGRPPTESPVRPS